jgi:hypothetical protein
MKRTFFSTGGVLVERLSDEENLLQYRRRAGGE